MEWMWLRTEPAARAQTLPSVLVVLHLQELTLKWLPVSLQDSPMHKALFWVAMAVLQLDEVNLYSAGTALLEQNLHTLDSLRVFNDKVSPEPSKGNPTSVL